MWDKSDNMLENTEASQDYKDLELTSSSCQDHTRCLEVSINIWSQICSSQPPEKNTDTRNISISNSGGMRDLGEASSQCRDSSDCLCCGVTMLFKTKTALRTVFILWSTSTTQRTGTSSQDGELDFNTDWRVLNPVTEWTQGHCFNEHP